MKQALVVLFNQDFSKNIPKLEEIYRDRFSDILYVVPDHTSRLDRLYKGSLVPAVLVLMCDRLFSAARRFLGRRNANELHGLVARNFNKKIIRVVGHQFYFYHYIVQAAGRLLKSDVDWYWIAADDALLNPRLNESNLPGKLGVDSGTDLVLCRPVYGSDDWISHVCGSVDLAARKVESALGVPPPWVAAENQIRSEDGANHNRYIPVACMDFFGLSRRLLVDVSRVWKRCFDNRLYVELAGPVGLLSKCGDHVYLDAYDWRRAATTDVMEALYKDLDSSDRNVFSHPIKLSMVN